MAASNAKRGPGAATDGRWPGGLPQAVIFDCDGVLADSEPVSSHVAADVLTSYGVPMTAAECHARFTGHKAGIQREHAEGVLGRPLAPEYEAVFEAELITRYQTELRPHAGAPELVAALAERAIPICVASNGNPNTATGALGAIGLLPRFEGRVFTSRDVRHGKPAPDLFLFAAERLGAEPGRCLVIEDSLPGIEAGKAAGMTVWALVGTLRAELLTPADRVFETLHQMREALGL